MDEVKNHVGNTVQIVDSKGNKRWGVIESWTEDEDNSFVVRFDDDSTERFHKPTN